MADSDSQQVRDEFLAEAQELVEGLSRDLLVLDQSQKEQRSDPDSINEVFRAVHTLKGISGMFGFHQVGAVAHALEDLLDDLRLGRVELSQEVLDVLFEGVENVQRLLTSTGTTDDAAAMKMSKYAESIERVSSPQKSATDALSFLDIDPGVLSVLTEYEEHRLRTNAEQGVPLFRLQVKFSLASIDTELEELKTRAKPLAELITYLPSMGESDGNAIDLDVILASRASFEELDAALSGPDAMLSAIERVGDAPDARAPAGTVPPPAVPPAQALLPSARPAAHEDEPATALSLRSVANTVRVDIRKLDHLMNVVGELALVRGSLERLAEQIRARTHLPQEAMALDRAGRSFERRLADLQAGILDVRMVPMRQVFDKLARIVRQVAREHEKEIKLVVTGADTEVDKLIVEELSDPLMHIIRNAIDHGIERPKMRELSGKATLGTLALNAYQKGNHVVIEIEDDGGGMNPERLLEIAVHKGLVAADSRDELSRRDVLSLVFLPGFTTRSAITETSGRGVGMDVVKTNIAHLGGIVDVQSEHGIGTKFTITLPITLAIISALTVEVAGKTFAIPLASVQEALQLRPAEIRTFEGREVVTLRRETLLLCRLGQVFELRSRNHEPDRGQYIIVVSLGSKRLGFVIDALHGQRDVIIKPLGKSLKAVKGFAGAADLGEQTVALVLDAPALLEEVLDAGELSVAAEASL